jgi:hypothetical protein
VLDSHPDINFIAGTAVSAEAAVQVLQKRKLEQQIKVIAYYFGPGVYRGIKRGATQKRKAAIRLTNGYEPASARAYLNSDLLALR